jgi:hypothetical protein
MLLRFSMRLIFERSSAKFGLTSLELGRRSAHNVRMADSDEQPVMLPFQDKEGTGWHVIIRYHAGHERRIDGFATQQDALDWIIANSNEVDK